MNGCLFPIGSGGLGHGLLWEWEWHMDWIDGWMGNFTYLQALNGIILFSRLGSVASRLVET